MKKIIILLLTALLVLSCKFGKPEEVQTEIMNDEEPKIVNIINFCRLLEPRIEEFTEDVLFNTVVEQVKMMRQYKLKGTFLLQYDALMDSRYQKLMTSLPRDTFEIGAWWELPQPLIENAGLKWRGRYPWDWHANVGFTTGYTPEERVKIANVYMEDFRKIFGYYPETVGSWFVDAYTLGYLFDNYGIKTSCICKDQIGTDGYTVWGGYWNQAYYPSKVNSYMPAQSEEKQIPVPVFRMLGSDPVRQYDKGVPPGQQDVMSLEPVYRFGGGDSTWVHWFYDQLVNGESLEFNYTQTGQENSFTWGKMQKGYAIQMPLIAKLRDENKLKVETLGESGKWFRENYKLTPATSMIVSDDLGDSDMKTAWYNCRFYRTNLLWQNGTLRIRDIHMFDEDLESLYTKGHTNTTYCEFFTLPFVDGYLWSTPEDTAGMWFRAVTEKGEVLLEGGDPGFAEPDSGILQVTWPLTNIDGTLVLSMDEKGISMKLDSDDRTKWYVELTTAASAKLPFRKMTKSRVDCTFEELDYYISAEKGNFSKPDDGVMRITPEGGEIRLNFAER